MNESIREFIEQHRTKLIGGGVLLLFVVALMWSMISSNPDKSNSSELVIDQSKVPQASVSESVAQQQQLTEMNQKSVAVTPPQSTVTPGNPQSQSPAASNGKTDTPAADANGVAMDDESTIATPATNTVPASPANPNKALNQSAQPMVSQPTQSANTVIKLAPVNTNSSTSNATTPVAANKKSKANKSTATKASAMGYRLQLIGLSDKKRLENFVQANHLQGKVDYLHTNKNGKDWYVVLYGHYATATQARHAINGLPKAVQTLNPWVRNMNATAAVQTAKSSHKASLKPAPVTKLSATTKTTTKVASTATSKKSVDTVKVTKAKVKVVASAVQKPKVAPAPAPKQTDNFIIDESIDG